MMYSSGILLPTKNMLSLFKTTRIISRKFLCVKEVAVPAVVVAFIEARI